MSEPHESSDRKPSHRLYQVIGDGETANWVAIGAAWPNRDGRGFNLTCDAIPLHGRMVLRSTEKEGV